MYRFVYVLEITACINSYRFIQSTDSTVLLLAKNILLIIIIGNF
jgi:hypothetical protein